LLKVFFSVAHNPTELDRQGNDVGPQYRGAIFTTSAEQATIAAAYIKQLDAAKVFDKPIVTKLTALERFHPAEIYHQAYVTRNMNDPYVVENDLPKIETFKTAFPQLYRR
jgi:peptide-methionine (S)-S-oxide reductase